MSTLQDLKQSFSSTKIDFKALLKQKMQTNRYYLINELYNILFVLEIIYTMLKQL